MQTRIHKYLDAQHSDGRKNILLMAPHIAIKFDISVDEARYFLILWFDSASKIYA